MLHIGKLIGIGKEREIKYDTQPLRLIEWTWSQCIGGGECSLSLSRDGQGIKHFLCIAD